MGRGGGGGGGSGGVGPVRREMDEVEVEVCSG